MGIALCDKIIGGMFGLEFPRQWVNPASISAPAFLRGRHIKLATARAGLCLLGLFLKPKTVWLPSYLCSVMLGAFSSTCIRFYAVDDRLRVAEDKWLSEVVPGDIVIFIDYFGFSLWSDWGAEARQRGAWIVEDASQALLNSEFCRYADYIIFSPRKFVGIPDGGILLVKGKSKLPDEELPPPPTEWWLDAFAASQLRAEFDRHGGNRGWFNLFRKIDVSGPFEPTRMSELSWALLTHSIDFNEVARCRRENYLVLASAIPELALFPDLPTEVVPIGFPIKLQNRTRVLQALFDLEVFPPVHWPLDGYVPPEFSESHRLSHQLMTVPCDQRIDPDTIKDLASTLVQMTEKAGELRRL